MVDRSKKRVMYDCATHQIRTVTTHGMASLTKHKSGWRAHVFVHGVRVTKVFEKRRDAQAWAAAKEKELQGSRAAGKMTFAQATTKYLETVTRDKAASAAPWEERRFAEMTEFFGESTQLAAIDSGRIGEWRDARLKVVSASTLLRQRALLLNLFSVAVKEWKVLQTNPFDGVRMPEHNPARHQVWPWRLVKRVLRAQNLNERERQAVQAFHIALHTGMRLQEILSAELVGDVAVLERDKGSGKASPPVKVPLVRKGASLFAKYGPFTIRPDVASATFSRVTDSLLIEDLTFHDSRASALTWLSRRLDVMTLARISRHKNMKILMDTYYRETAEQIAARLKPAGRRPP